MISPGNTAQEEGRTALRPPVRQEMETMNKICIIGVYFGPLPRYFELWERSAAANPTVDFLVFTDRKPAPFSENVRTVPMTLSEMRALAEKKLRFPGPALTKPYKCCDFKPVYGIIFEDYLQQYDYWGHCDFDMIFGSLETFFEKYDLRAYDKFLTLGHLTLYRNSPEVLGRYRCDGAETDYKTVFSSDRGFYFDELKGMTRIYSVNGFSQFTKRIFCDISCKYRRFREINTYPLDRKAENHRKQIYYWQNGHVYKKWFSRAGEHRDEYIYIHFKNRPDFEIGAGCREAKGFYVTNRGFFPLNGEPREDSANKYNRYRPLRELYETALRLSARMLKKAYREVKRALKQPAAHP